MQLQGGGKEMSLKGKRIGFGFTGSHCTYEEVMPHLEKLIAEGAEVRPLFHTLFNQQILDLEKEQSGLRKLKK